MMTSALERNTDFIEASIQKRLTELANKHPGDAITALTFVEILMVNLHHDDWKVRRDAG